MNHQPLLGDRDHACMQWNRHDGDDEYELRWKFKTHSALAIILITTVSDFSHTLRLQDVQTGESLLFSLSYVVWKNHKNIYSQGFAANATSSSEIET